MTYHRGSLGEIGTFKKFGGASARFAVSNLHNASETAAAPSKIVQVLRTIPGVLSADAAWSDGGVVLANLRMDEGALVDGTAATIRREAGRMGALIGTGVVVSVPSGGTKFTTADVVKTQTATPTGIESTPTPAAASYPVVINEGPQSAGLGVPAMVGIGVGALALAAGAFFLFRKKPARLTVAAA